MAQARIHDIERRADDLPYALAHPPMSQWA
jgi:hypothetical protein